MPLLRYNQWINKKQFINESVTPLSVLDGSEFVNFKAGDVVKSDVVVKEMLDDIENAAREAKVHVLVTCAITDHAGIHDNFSRHPDGQALDLSRIGNDTTPHSQLKGNPQSPGGPVKNQEFVDAADRLVASLIGLGYKLITHDSVLKATHKDALCNSESPRNPKVLIWKFYTKKSGNHYNHIHISNNGGVGYSTGGSSSDDATKPVVKTMSDEPSQEINIYSTQGDPYSYCVLNGVWFIKDGPQGGEYDWEFIPEWTSLELNCKLTQRLDERFPGARKSDEIELNRQKYCSFPNDIIANRKIWFNSINASADIIELGENKEDNNNPGNIRYNPDFEGCIGNSNGFCKFKTLGHGYRAIKVLLETYFDKYKLRTIQEIISRYAPPIENDTKSYIDLVSDISGFEPNTQLDKNQLVELIPGIVRQENSIKITTEEVIEKIQEVSVTDPERQNSVVTDNDTLSIYSPIGMTDPLPVFVFYGEGDVFEFKNNCLKSYSELLSNSMFVFPKDNQFRYDDLIKQIQIHQTDNKLTPTNYNLVMLGEGVQTDTIRSYREVTQINNIVMINPQPKSTLSELIRELVPNTKVYTIVSPTFMKEQYDDTQVDTFVNEFNMINKEADLNPTDYLKQIERDETNLLEASFNKFGFLIKENL